MRKIFDIKASFNKVILSILKAVRRHAFWDFDERPEIIPRLKFPMEFDAKSIPDQKHKLNVRTLLALQPVGIRTRTILRTVKRTQVAVLV